MFTIQTSDTSSFVEYFAEGTQAFWLKGASLSMKQDNMSSQDLQQIDPSWVFGTNISEQGLSPENQYMVVVMDGASCATVNNLVIEKPKPADAWGFNGNSGEGKWLGTNDSTDLVMKTNDLERMVIKADGNVGIGINEPMAKLDVAGDVKIGGGLTLSSISSYQTVTNCGRLLGLSTDGTVELTDVEQCMVNLLEDGLYNWGLYGNNVSSTMYIGSNNAQPFRIKTNGQQRLVIDENGQVTIGTPNIGIDSDYKLGVNGKIVAKEVVVTVDDWADFVFKDNYSLLSLNGLQNYIQTNKHLPDLPSKSELKLSGNNLGKMDALLLRKIEELTLYILQEQKEIDYLKSKIDCN